jgi:hypothetical protein
MFRHLVFLHSSSVYVVLYTTTLDPVALRPPETLTVRIAAKCFKMVLDRSFRLPLEVRGARRVKVNQNAIYPTRHSQFLMLVPSLRRN